MKVLLDHCLDWRLSRSLHGHSVKAAGKLGWGGLKDCPLLAKAQTQFDVLVTSDKNLPCQQNLHIYNLAVAILDVPSNRLEDCLPKIPTLLKMLPLLPKRRATVI
jgi:predicted nuclease of predicted toxin-antitoxin system